MKLGFIGLGNMGHPMAANLLKAGNKLTVNDVRKEAARDLLSAGAVWADSPREVAAMSEIVLTSLPGPPEVEKVALGASGIIAGAAKGSAYIDMSTNSPAVIKRIAGVFSEKGLEVLDAPVSGGSHGAEAATLAIMVGGEKKTFERCLPVLKTLGGNIFHVGDIGSGNKVKLVNNLLGAINLYASIECMVLAKKAGLDVKTVFDILKAGGATHIFEQKMPKSVLIGNFDAGFSTDWAYKDLDLANQMAREVGVPLFVGSYVQQRLLEAKTRGWGKKDWSSMALALEEACDAKARF